ncbi:unnamed protein product [Staurois parvus]|uniref:Uncharacterized protein n=1 Tax=Staurois parvus TaxID=386267 RepID=A0ABN9HU36_9NEOB|nr:unnamed protein product [Staurois parvus]
MKVQTFWKKKCFSYKILQIYNLLGQNVFIIHFIHRYIYRFYFFNIPSP